MMVFVVVRCSFASTGLLCNNTKNSQKWNSTTCAHGTDMMRHKIIGVCFFSQNNIFSTKKSSQELTILSTPLSSLDTEYNTDKSLQGLIPHLTVFISSHNVES